MLDFTKIILDKLLMNRENKLINKNKLIFIQKNKIKIKSILIRTDSNYRKKKYLFIKLIGINLIDQLFIHDNNLMKTF